MTFKVTFNGITPADQKPHTCSDMIECKKLEVLNGFLFFLSQDGNIEKNTVAAYQLSTVVKFELMPADVKP
jgi:hypothetical protein